MEVIARYLAREPLTQSLPYAAILQARGLGCLLCGAAVLLIQTHKGALRAKMQRPRQIDVASLRSIIARTQATTVVLEPAPVGVLVGPEGKTEAWRYDVATHDELCAQMRSFGLRLADTAIAHSKTRVLDLAGGHEAVLAAMSSTARRNIRGAQRDGLVYRSRPFCDVDEATEEALRRLHTEFHATRPYLKNDCIFREHMMRQFGASGDLITAHEGPRMVGAVYVPRHDRVAHYYAVVTSDECSSPKLGTGLVALALRSAVDAGCDLFDFVGVRDERYPEIHGRWDGFTAFKARFGGHDVYMPPSLTLAELST